MTSARWYRLCFALGCAAVLASVGLGVAGAVREEHRLPPLIYDPLPQAQRRFRGEDPERWIAEARTLTYITPRNRRAFIALGNALADVGRVEPAIAAFERARSINGLPGLAHARLATLYLKKGRTNEARAEVAAALAKGISVSGPLRALAEPAGP